MGAESSRGASGAAEGQSDHGSRKGATVKTKRERKIADYPTFYLHWLFEQPGTQDPIRQEIHYELHTRGPQDWTEWRNPNAPEPTAEAPGDMKTTVKRWYHEM